MFQRSTRSYAWGMAQSAGSSSQCVVDLNQTDAARNSDIKIGDSQTDEVDKSKNVDEIELTFRKVTKFLEALEVNLSIESS